MSRKEASFGQLYDYVTRSQDNDARFHYYHNFLRLDAESIVTTFKDNAQLLPKRKNGNYLYHEVLSITRAKHLSETQQKKILHHIAHQYIQRRAGDCLVFGGIHDEKDNNLHYHLIISANKVGENKRYRLKKAEFDTIKKELELYVLERYPELEQQKLISKENAKKAPQATRGEQGVKQRTGERRAPGNAHNPNRKEVELARYLRCLK